MIFVLLQFPKFIQERESTLQCYLCKYINKRARYAKLALADFTASAVYIRGLPQIYEQTSEIRKACFSEFHSECSIYSKFTSNIQT